MLEDITLTERQAQVIIRAGKGNKARTVPLNASIRGALVKYAQAVWEEKLTVKNLIQLWPKAQSGKKPTPLWTSERGNQLHERELSRMIHSLILACGAQGLISVETTPHSLRHTFASFYLAKHGDDIVGLARLLGHSSLDTTKIYIQPTVEELMTRLDRIDLNAYGH